MLAYLSRYTHRVAIANSRLIAFDHANVTFRWKDYRADGRDRQKVMRLATGEFIRRFLIHVLPHGGTSRHQASVGLRMKAGDEVVIRARPVEDHGDVVVVRLDARRLARSGRSQQRAAQRSTKTDFAG